MGVERLGIDDHAGVHPPSRIKGSFELAESSDQLSAEHPRQQFGAREAVAMLAGKRAAELRHQLSQIDHRGAELRDPVGGEEIKVDAAVNATLAEMSIVGCGGEIVARQHRDED